MRLFNERPGGFVALAAAVIVAELALSLVPVAGRPAANMIVPILACSLIYASLAVDRNDRPRAAHLVAPFAAPVAAIAAVIVASLVVFAAEAVIAWLVAGVNLLDPHADGELGPAEILIVYGVGVATSLPLTLVPLLALFEGASVREAFRSSLQAFARNVPAFLLYGLLSLALLGLAFFTMGLGLLIALPLWAASSYAAWKDVYGIGHGAGRSGPDQDPSGTDQ
jgi:hypothetical protein